MHTVVRPAGGIMLGLAAMGGDSALLAAMGSLLGGASAATTHTIKASARLAVNTSPEPFSNIGFSLGENAAVAGGVTLLLMYPWLWATISLVLLIFFWWIIPKIWRRTRSLLWLMWRKLLTLGSRRNPLEKAPDEITAAERVALDQYLKSIQAPVMEGDTFLPVEEVSWAVKGVLGTVKKIDKLKSGQFGALVWTSKNNLYFIAKTFSSRVVQKIPTPGDKARISWHPSLLGSSLHVEHADGRVFHFRQPNDCESETEWVFQQLNQEGKFYPSQE